MKRTLSWIACMLVACVASAGGGEAHLRAPPPRATTLSSNPFLIHSAMRSNSGWMLLLRSHAKWEEVQARPQGRAIWTPAQAHEGGYYHVSFAELPERARIEVRGILADGALRGPYVLRLNTLEALQQQAMDALRMTPAAWLSLQPAVSDDDRYNLYFTHVLSWRCGLREVRYSIDNEALDEYYDLPPCGLEDPVAIRDTSNLYRTLPGKPHFVAVQLRYADGSLSDIVYIRPHRN